MSGGHWQYLGHRIESDLLMVAEDPDVQARWPHIGVAIATFAKWFRDVEHEMDYDLSGDTKITPDAAFDMGQFGKLLDEFLKAAPDVWFLRGKWATIQAVQGRIEEAKP